MFNLDETPNAPEEEKDFNKFIVNPKGINKTIQDFFNGDIKKGYEIGIPCFDEHFVCKENELYALTGKKGGGKTTINQAIQIMHSIVSDLVWVCAFQENSDWGQKLNYLNYFLGEHANIIKNTNPKLYNKASKWIDAHFIFLDVETIKDALDTTKFLIENGTKVHALVLDPANSFQSGFANTGNGYADGVETARKVLRFTEKYCTVYVSQHPNITAQRNPDRIITSYDAEGGWWLNKASFTWVIHRVKDTHKNNIIVEDVRNKHTGGSRTDLYNELIIEWLVTTINIIQGDDIHINVIQYLVRKHNPINFDYEYLPETEEILPSLTSNEAFEFSEQLPF